MAYPTFRYKFPTEVIFGCGSRKELHQHAIPGEKCLLVISNGKSMRENGVLDEILRELAAAGAEVCVFDRVGANPTTDMVRQGVALARGNGCDFVAALGGGSVIDCAKCISLAAPQTHDIWEYAAAGTGGRRKPEKAPLPLIAIPTTAGTGSEMDTIGVATNPETSEKYPIGKGMGLYPVLTVVDAEIMASVPPRMTAYQGMDAFFHLCEGYFCSMSTPMSDMIDLHGVRLVAEYLPRAVRDGGDMEARENMAFASSLGGYSMEFSSCTSLHAMEHALSAYHPELPHGAGLVILSEAYFTFFAEKHVLDRRFAELAAAMRGRTGEPADFIEELKKLIAACGLEDLKMSDFGITPDEFPQMVQRSYDMRNGSFSCDRYAMTPEECRSIFERAYR